MKQIFIALVLLTSAFSFAEFSFPSGLSTSQAEDLLDTFGVGFLGKWPASYTRDKYQSQVNVSWNQIDTKEVAKLGSGTSDEVVQYQEFHFSQELPYSIEVGIQASLLGLDNSMNSFGGFARWSFYEVPYGRLSFGAHGTGANYRNLMGVNLYGGIFEADLIYRNLIFTFGLGQLRSTANFQAHIFGLGGDQPMVRAAKRYAHQMYRVSYSKDKWNISMQSDYIVDFTTAFMLGYLF